MPHATLHTTNHPRRAHPAVIRAALRSRRRATYTYDTKQLRQIGESVTYATNGAPFTLASSTTYNALGQKTSHTYPDGASYTYSYDTNNQLSTVNLPQGYGSITLNSYLWNVPSQITLPGGTVRNYSYDGLLRLKELDIKDPGQSQVLNTQYGYDLTGNIVSKASSTSSLQASANTTHYSYDTLDHLTGATYSNSSQTGSTGSPQANESYSYDPLANRITGSNANAQGSNHSYNANNQLTQAGSVSYTYDANGNTTSQTDSSDPTNTRSYVYDTDNRLIEVHDASNAIIATYRYDPFGRRLSKTLSNTASTGSAQAPAGSSTYYFYSAEGLIAEADANGQITQSYGYAPNTTFSTNPLWTKLSTAGTATYYTYQNDHLGTPQKLLNQSGITVWSATYDAFGRATVDPASTISNNLRLPGQYADQETGLHYNWMRFYDPTTGRYVTSDPIGLYGGINTYVYVDGNPVRYADPYGLFGMADMPTIPQGVVDFSAGFGDTLSFGLTDLIRDQMGTNGAVDKCSGAFTGGQYASFGVLATTSVSKLAAWGWRAGLNGGSRSVFWSGSNAAKIEAQKLGTSLEKTPIGKALDWLHNNTPIKVDRAIWDAASRTFANNAEGMATAVLQNARAGSTWNRVERGILENRGVLVNIITLHP